MFWSKLVNSIGQKIDPNAGKLSRKHRTLNEGRPIEDGLGGTLHRYRSGTGFKPWQLYLGRTAERTGGEIGAA